MGKYSNGIIPPAARKRLVSAKGHSLTPMASRLFDAMSRAYREQFGQLISVTDSYRSLAAQIRVYKDKGPGLAARPGTSVHGLGKAVDLGGGINRFGTDEHEWVVKHGRKFGWVHPHWARKGGGREEAWHFEHEPVLYKVKVKRLSNLRYTPNGKVKEHVKSGVRLNVVRGSEWKRGSHTWLLTTRGLWIASTQVDRV